MNGKWCKARCLFLLADVKIDGKYREVSMKAKKFLLGVLLILMAVLCVGCSSGRSYEGKTKVIFELEGGTYQNCVRPIVQYYDFKEGTQNLIVEPTQLSKAEITRSGSQASIFSASAV